MIAKPKDFCTAVVLLIITALLYVQSNTANVGVQHAMGPMFFPRMVLFCIGGLSLILLIQSLRRPRGATKPGEATPKAETGERMLQLGFTGLFLLYLVALPFTGYLPSTLGFLFVAMLLLGPRKPRSLALYAVVAVAVTLGLQYVFSDLLHLFLP